MNHARKKNFASVREMNQWLRDVLQGRSPYGEMLPDQTTIADLQEPRKLELYAGFLSGIHPQNVYILGTISAPDQHTVCLEFDILWGEVIEDSSTAMEFIGTHDDAAREDAAQIASEIIDAQ